MTGYTDFEEFVVARRDALLRTAYLLTGDHHDAEDLVQSALIKVVPKWARIKDRPEPYVRRVLARESVNRWRGRRWREVTTDVVPDAMHHDSTDRIALLEDLRRLSARQRAVLVLRYFDDLSEADTAAALGISWELSSRTSATRWRACATSGRATSNQRLRRETRGPGRGRDQEPAGVSRRSEEVVTVPRYPGPCSLGWSESACSARRVKTSRWLMPLSVVLLVGTLATGCGNNTTPMMGQPSSSSGMIGQRSGFGGSMMGSIPHGYHMSRLTCSAPRTARHEFR